MFNFYYSVYVAWPFQGRQSNRGKFAAIFLLVFGLWARSDKQGQLFFFAKALHFIEVVTRADTERLYTGLLVILLGYRRKHFILYPQSNLIALPFVCAVHKVC